MPVDFGHCRFCGYKHLVRTAAYACPDCMHLTDELVDWIQRHVPGTSLAGLLNEAHRRIARIKASRMAKGAAR